MRVILAFIALLALSSCSLFSTDVEPLLRAQEAQTALFDRHSAAFEKTVRAVAMDEAQRATLLGAIEMDRAAYAAVAASVLEWAAAVGDVDWKEEFKRLIEQIKGGAK